MAYHRNNGQTLVEVAFVLPILLILLVGAYATTRTVFLKSRAESTSFAEAIRAGRNLPGIEQDLSRAIMPEEDEVYVRSGRKGKSRPFPAPFPSLAGKTDTTVAIRKQWREIGAPRWVPQTNIQENTRMSVDCWGKDTSSGNKIRRWIRGYIFLGTIR
jgi:type II secretory pathway component PulJ